jgi:hypothetical protein
VLFVQRKQEVESNWNFNNELKICIRYVGAARAHIQTGTIPYCMLYVHPSFIFFIHRRLYSPLLGPGFFYNSVIFFTQSVGLFGRGISPSQGPYLHAGQHKHRINAHRYPCLKWDSNRQSQLSSERRQFMS